MEDEQLVFNSIDDFYSQIENKNLRDTVSFAIRKLIEETVDDSLKRKLQVELAIFEFLIEDGQVFPMTSFTTNDGKVVEYPSYENFTDDTYNYIEERIQQVKNDYLVIRYNQVLWYSPNKKKNQFAKNVVDASLRILAKAHTLKNSDECWLWYVTIINGLHVSTKIKYLNIDYYAQLTSILLTTKKIDYQYKYFMISVLYSKPKYLNSYVNETLSILTRSIQHAKKNKNTSLLEDMYETGLSIAQRIGTDTRIWNKRMGDLFVLQAESRMDDETKMVPLSFYKEAISYYKLAGTKKRVQAIETRYAELKGELKLNSFEIPHEAETTQKIIDIINESVKQILKNSPDKVCQYLSHGKILPDLETLRTNKNSDSVLLQLARQINFDINNNITSTNQKDAIIESYNTYFQLSVRPYLHKIFIQGILDRKITYQSIMKYFNASWFGETLKDTKLNNERSYNWTSLIAPAIYEYFRQMEYALKTNQPTNYILAIDSLALKFEGAIRDFAKNIGISPTVSGKKDVLREKYIEDILADKMMKKYFSEDELFFFNYLFVSKDGFNIRSNVAHCFYKHYNYSFELMHYIMFAFLRLGKYPRRKHKEVK